MMKIFLPLLTALALMAAVGTIPDPYAPIEHYRLDNGMEVYLLSDAKSKNTSIAVSVDVGMEAEDARTSGLSHLVEHMVFRDRRVAHRDYADYIEDEGGSYVNGFTSRYKTSYVATINSGKSYWIASTFAQMLFDENVSQSDLESERGAVQTEIGEYRLPKRLLRGLYDLFVTLYPDDDFYSQAFVMAKDRQPLPNFYAQRNNMHFTLDEVMRHYRKYYYPSNMTLQIVGNFDTANMKRVINETYGHYHRERNATVREPDVMPKLNGKPTMRFHEGVSENSGYIGAKYILDDYKKHLIIGAYTANAASRLQKQLRNKLGQNYNVSPYLFNDRKAGVASVSFDGLRSNFEDNIRIVKNVLAEDAASIDDDTIDDALRAYRDKHYGAVEHDSRSLMSLVQTQEYLNTRQHIADETPYAIFKSISHDDFRRVISEAFTPQNSYSVIYRDYYFFPYDTIVLSLLSTILLIFVYFKLYRIDYWRKGLRYTKRDIVFERRLSNRFLGFLLFVFVFMLSTIAWEWVKYWFFDLLTGDPHYLMTLDVPYSYLADVFDMVLQIAFFAAVYKFGFSYFARLDVDRDALYLVGNNIVVLKKNQIDSVDVAHWSPTKFFKIKGAAIAFWRPLVKITMNDGRTLYLRSNNARHLKEDIEKSLQLEA